MDKDTMAALMSSEKTSYETPDVLFNTLNDLFRFELDVCATEDNAKLPHFISPEQDAFLVDWDRPFFMNPPYGGSENACRPMCVKKTCAKRGFHINERKPGIDDWVKRAAHFGKEVTGCCLLPSRTGENWVQTVFDQASLILFVRKRLTFKGAPSCAPFPSMICTFGYIPNPEAEAATLKKIGNVVIPDQGIIRYEAPK